MHRIHSGLFALALLPVFWGTAQAQSFDQALTDGKPIIDLRARYEDVTDASKAVAAEAQTLRARIGYETGSWNGLQLTVEFDQIWALGGTPYNSTRNGKTAYPLIADPNMTALNRLQLAYTSDFHTKFVLGRQRLQIGNQRFIGNSGWRQHEQTFDALAVTNTTLEGLTLNYAYLYRVNRVNGPAMPVPANTTTAATGQASYFQSNSHVMDATYTGIAGLRLESYAFLLDLSAPGYAGLPVQTAATAKLSTATYGGRGDYSVPLDKDFSAKFSGEFAHQTNYAANPIHFGLNYWLGEASLSWQGVTGLAGYEALGGNGSIGFSTPLATLHIFNGWADQFLTTPTNGLKDLYLKANYSLPMNAFAMKALNMSVAWHDFKTDALSKGIGGEWDMQGELVVNGNLSFLAKYADYAGSGIPYGGFADKRIFWLQGAYSY